MNNLTCSPTASDAQWSFNRLDWMDNRQLEPNTWVKLSELLNPFADDEALLLCPESDLRWVVWIPNHGEAIVEISQFVF